MTRDELVEAITEAMHARLGDEGEVEDLAEAAMKTIEESGLAVVPSEPTRDMCRAMLNQDQWSISAMVKHYNRAENFWSAMIEAGRIK